MSSPWQRTIWRAENMGRRLRGFRSLWWVVIVLPAQLAVAAFEAIPSFPTLWGNRKDVNSVFATSQFTRHLCFHLPICLLTLFPSVKTHLGWVGFFFPLQFFSPNFKKYIFLSSSGISITLFFSALLPKCAWKQGDLNPAIDSPLDVNEVYAPLSLEEENAQR